MIPSSSRSFAARIRSAGLASKAVERSTGYSTFISTSANNSRRPRHNPAVPFGRKATIAVKLCLIAPEAAIWQLTHGLSVHRLDEAGLDALHCTKFFREHGKQIIITSRNVRRNYTKGTRI